MNAVFGYLRHGIYGCVSIGARPLSVGGDGGVLLDLF